MNLIITIPIMILLSDVGDTDSNHDGDDEALVQNEDDDGQDNGDHDEDDTNSG